MNLETTSSHCTRPEQILKEEYLRKKSRNQAYSLRAFASYLGLSSGRLSEYFNQKRRISQNVAIKIASKIEDQEIREMFLTSFESDLSLEKQDQMEYFQLKRDQYEIISDWHHYAILNLMKLDDFTYDLQWISSRLNISKDLTQSSLEKLLRVSLIEEVTLADGTQTVQRTNGRLTTTHDIPSEALKEAHRQNINQAIEAIDEVPVELRDISSITMSLDPAMLPKAKEKIKKFRREMQALMESGKKEEVYNLNIQMVPVTQRRQQ